MSQADVTRLRRYWLLPGGVIAVTLLLFGIVAVVQPAVLADPDISARDAGAAAAVLGVGLLVVDALLPVPSSVVMVALGAAFGVPLGAALSLVGSFGAFLVGFAAGRGGRSRMSRFVPEGELHRADALLDRWGLLAIVVTRPVPILAETTAAMAGASRMPLGRAALAAAAGALPGAVVYALAGSLAVDASMEIVVIVTVLVVGGLLWAVARHTPAPPANVSRATTSDVVQRDKNG
ncbi:MAG: VTT domain-containing protein [Acidimicrobiales bacterium]